MTLAIKQNCNWNRFISLVVLPSSIVIYSSGVNAADESQFDAATGIASEQIAIHGQATYVEQETSSFRAPYSGPDSLTAPEQIIETYYKLAVIAHADLSVDYQWAKNPAYNTERGPVSIVAVRLHAQF